MGCYFDNENNKEKYSDLRIVYLSNVRSSIILPSICKSKHLIKVPIIKCTKVITNTNYVIFHFIFFYVAILLQNYVLNRLFLFYIMYYNNFPKINTEPSSVTRYLLLMALPHPTLQLSTV
jgi:hypothetical protein